MTRHLPLPIPFNEIIRSYSTIIKRIKQEKDLESTVQDTVETKAVN